MTPAPSTTNPARVVGQAAGVAQRIGTSAGTGAQTSVLTGPQLLSAVTTALQGLAQPLQSLSGLSGILDGLGFSSLQSFLSLGNLVVPCTASMATADLGIGATHFAQTAGVVGAAEADAASSVLAGEFGSGTGALVPAGPTGLGGSAVSAGMGQGTLVGGLSVPPGWATAAPEIRSVATALPITGAPVAQAMLTGTSANMFSEMALASMAGSAMGGTVRLGRREHVTAAIPERVRPPQRALGDPVTGIAADLRELAELRDSRVLTDEEFNKLKQRILARCT